jgi:hypothetical protein
MKRFEYTYNREALTNQTYIQSAILQNRNILEVYIDGIGRSKITSDGSTPIGQEVDYVASLGRITFPSALPIYTKIVVLYQDL